MAELTRIQIPLINPNEVEVVLASLEISEGQQVESGALLATLESTKSTGEVYAEQGGYVTGLIRSVGDTLKVGDLLCYLADEPGHTVPGQTVPAAANGGQATGTETVPEGLRITQPALALAQQAGLDLATLPTGKLVTEAVVREALAKAHSELSPVPQPASLPPFDPTAVIIYGGGGHGKMIIELLRLTGGYHLVGLIDDGLPPGADVLGVPVLGGGDRLPDLAAHGIRLAVNAVGGIGNVTPRLKVFEKLAQAGMACPAIVHPSAVVESSASLAPGCHVLARAYVGPLARIGFGSIVNTGAIVSHDCQIGETVAVSPGALLAGGVIVGDKALIGMGATVNLEVKIGAGARVGNSATVKADVPAGGIVRAGTIWPA